MIELRSAPFPIGVVSAIDRRSSVPLWLQISQAIEQEIEHGGVAAGAWLPDEATLARRFAVSRVTLRHAVQRLVDAGRLLRVRGLGTQVTTAGSGFTGAQPSAHDGVLLGPGEGSPTRTLLDRTSITPDPASAALLGLALGQPVLSIRRLWTPCGGAPVLLEDQVVVPLAFTDEELNSAELLPLMARHGAHARTIQRRMSVRVSNPTERKILGIERNASVLVVERLAFDEHNRPLVLGTHVHTTRSHVLATTTLSL